jgi:CHAD domain-containing protein
MATLRKRSVARSSSAKNTDFAAAMQQALHEWRQARRRILHRGATPSAVHAWRISTRRLFALEELLAPDPRRDSDSLHEALAKAFHTSGKLRDTQLAIHQLKLEHQRFPLVSKLTHRLHEKMPRQRRRLVRQLRAIKPQVLGKIILRWHRSHQDFEKVAQARVPRRLERARALLDASRPRTVALLHRQRLHMKSLRYMIELCRRAGYSVPRTPWTARRLSSLQQTIGRITDLQVLLALLQKHGERDKPLHGQFTELRRQLLRRRQHLLAGVPRFPYTAEPISLVVTPVTDSVAAMKM